MRDRGRRRAAGRRLLAIGAAAGAGVLYALAHVGFGLWPLLFLCLTPLWLAWEAARPRGALAAAGLGLLFGGAAHAVGHAWLWRLVEVFLDGSVLLGSILWLAHGLVFALAFALYGLLFHALRRRGAPLALAAGPPLLGVEWLWPQLFPVYAGAGLIGAPVLAQGAELGGPLLLSALVVAGNLACLGLAETGRRDPRLVPRRVALSALALLLLAVGYGVLRLQALDGARGEAPALRVGLVQEDLGLLEKRRGGVAAHRRHLEATRALLEGGPLDLVVWPETAYAQGLRLPLPLSGRAVGGGLSVPLLFGGTAVREEGGRRVSSNAAFLVGDDGRIRDAYEKNLLIPLAEAPPLAGRVPGVDALFPHAQDFRAARTTPALRLGPWRLATPICYEAVRPDFVRRMVRDARPHLLVSLANDAWFGDSREPRIHLALARLRAIEHRRWMVRSTNSGISAIVDPAGRVVARTGLLTRETLRGKVHLRDDTTPYGLLGDWPGPLALAGVALTLVGRGRS